MRSSRVGAVVSNWEMMSLLIVLILTLGLMMATGSVAQSMARLVSDGFGQSDRARLGNAVVSMTSEGTAAISVRFDRWYPEIAIQGGQVTMTARNGDESQFDLPDRYTYRPVTLSGNSICVSKSGMTYAFSRGACDPPSCTEDSCATLTRTTADGDSVAYAGFYCRDRVYTDDAFFEQYYTTASTTCAGNDVSETFAKINRFACPDHIRVEGSKAGCVLVASYRCEAGGVDLSIALQGTSNTRELECTGNVEHRRVAMQIPDIGAQDGDAETVTGFVRVDAATRTFDTETVEYGTSAIQDVPFSAGSGVP